MERRWAMPADRPIAVYVAGTMHDASVASGWVAAELVRAGFRVVSRWHDPGQWRSEERQTDAATRRAIAAGNLADIDAADVVLAVPFGDHHLRGAHVEVGYALGRGKPVVVHGDERSMNTMTNAAGVVFCRTWSAVEAALREVAGKAVGDAV